jgi:hypothetical protein
MVDGGIGLLSSAAVSTAVFALGKIHCRIGEMIFIQIFASAFRENSHVFFNFHVEIH